MLISELVVVEWVFYFLVSASSLGFQCVCWLCASCFPDLSSWCVLRESLLVLETGIRDELEEGRLEERGFVIH